MPETSPGVRPELAESIPCAYVVSDDGDGTVVVRPAGTQRARRVSGAFVYPACIDGASSLSFRGEGGGSAGRAVSRARSAGAEATAEKVPWRGVGGSAGFEQEKGLTCFSFSSLEACFKQEQGITNLYRLGSFFFWSNRSSG